MSETRRYERIDIELPCRIFIPGTGGLRFEAFATSVNLGLGGLFVATSFLLREGLEVYVELALPDGPLTIRSRIAHAVGQDDPELQTGMGIEFLDVDAHGRETLLRYFTPLRYSSPVVPHGALQRVLRSGLGGVPATLEDGDRARRHASPEPLGGIEK